MTKQELSEFYGIPFNDKNFYDKINEINELANFYNKKFVNDIKCRENLKRGNNMK